MEQIKSYQDLIAWQRAMDLVVLSYQLAKALPKDELYGLLSQIKRAATSVPANIWPLATEDFPCRPTQPTFRICHSAPRP